MYKTKQPFIYSPLGRLWRYKIQKVNKTCSTLIQWDKCKVEVCTEPKGVREEETVWKEHRV